MLNGMTTKEWFDRIRGDDTINAVADKAGIVQSTLLRQLKRGHLGIVEIIKIARAYSTNPIGPLIETGQLTEDELRAWSAAHTLKSFTDREIADEVWRRMVEGEAGNEITDPADGPALSVIQDINAGSGQPIAALQSDRNKEFEERENQ